MHRISRSLRPARVALGLLLAGCDAAPGPAAIDGGQTRADQAPAAARVSRGMLQMRVDAGRITVHARDVALGAVLEELQRQGALRLVARSELRERVSLDIDAAPLHAVLRRLLGPRDFLLLQGRAGSTVFIHAADPTTPAAAAPSPGVRENVEDRLEQLAAIPRSADGPAIRSLGEAATMSAVAAIREEAVAALGDIGGEDARTAIATALSDPDPQVRAAATRALGRTGDSAAVPALSGALAQGDRSQRLIAIDAMGRIGGPAAIRALQAARRHDDVRVRQAATEWLDEYARESAGAILKP